MRTRPRHTVGFFVDWLDNSYQQTLLDGVLSTAEREDVNVFCVEGGTIGSSFYYDSNRNFLYKLAGERRLDGLIILSASIGHYTSAEATAEFCRSFQPMPVVSIAARIEGIPSIVVDNSSGVKAAVAHLVTTHLRAGIAFIGGPRHNQDALERLDEYTRAMAEYGRIPDPRMIREGDFTAESGRRCASQLLSSGVPFDAVICANDDMALGAMEALRGAGRDVPKSVSVFGFDNIDAARAAIPPLATIDQPIREQGSAALRVLLQCIRGRKVEPVTTLPTQLVVRQSCGCFSAVDVDGDADELTGVLSRAVKTRDASAITELSTKALELVAAMRQPAAAGGPDAQARETDLLLRWDDFAMRLEGGGASLQSAQTVVSRLRKTFLATLNGEPEPHRRAENLFHRLRILTAERYLNAEKSSFNRLADEYRALNCIREQAIANPDEKAFYENLGVNLPLLPYRRLYVTRFLEPPGAHAPGHSDRSHSRLLFSYDRAGARYWGKEGAVFPSGEFLPPGTLKEGERFSVVVEAIVHQYDFGFIVIDIDPSRVKQCGEMRRVFSSYLQGLELFRQGKEAESLSKNLADLRKLMGGVIKTLTVTVETRDPYTAGHEHRVSDLARAIASKLELSRDSVEAIRMSALVHDLGKIYVPAEILNKPGRLRDAELNLIRMHPEIGWEILRTIDFPWPIADIVLQHHERMNGSGYPKGLSGDQIQREARILAVADVVEAMTMRRPYREALGLPRALEEIKANRGVLYDADAVDACITLFKDGFTFRESQNTE